MIDLRIANSQLSIFYYNRENHYSWWTQSKELPLFGSLIFCYFFLRRVDDTNNFSASSKTFLSNLERTEWQNSKHKLHIFIFTHANTNLNIDQVIHFTIWLLTLAMSISGMSEKSKIHSLKPKDKSCSRSCYKMAMPTKRGKDELPNKWHSGRKDDDAIKPW